MKPLKINGGDILVVVPKGFGKLHISAFSNQRNVFCSSNHTFEKYDW